MFCSLVQKKCPLLLSTSQAQQGRTFSQLSNLSFARLCTFTPHLLICPSVRIPKVLRNDLGLHIPPPLLTQLGEKSRARRVIGPVGRPQDQVGSPRQLGAIPSRLSFRAMGYLIQTHLPSTFCSKDAAGDRRPSPFLCLFEFGLDSTRLWSEVVPAFSRQECGRTTCPAAHA